MNRDEEILGVFADTLGVFERPLAELKLSHEETDAFEETVFLWFDRFARRPGNERIPAQRFQIPLFSAACKLARDLSARKGLSAPVGFWHPATLAADLGLADAPKKEDGR